MTRNRNARWRNARRAYDAGSGIRGVADLYAVLAFFEARQGQLHGFRFRDPVDHASCGPEETVSPIDQPIGIGDGAATTFQLVKTYGDAGGTTTREIVKPVAGTVVVAVDGETQAAASYAVDHATGIVTFGDAPSEGAAVSAGFEFDVPVRFDIDRIDIGLTAFQAGRIPTIPLVEIRP